MVYQVLARGEGADAVQDAAVLRDYFNLETALGPLSEDWASRDARFAAIRGFIPGERPIHDGSLRWFAQVYSDFSVVAGTGPSPSL